MRTVLLLGPQWLRPTLADEVDRLGFEGGVATITAGWQEREAEDGELREHLKRPVENLMLHQRCEEIFRDDPEILKAHRSRQKRLYAIQQIYRYRLDFTLEPARELLQREGEMEVLEPERQSALDAVRRLDREHLERIAAVHRGFEEQWEPSEQPSVLRHRQEIAEILDRAAALTIAGGHVGVLLNYLRLFGILDLIDPEKPIIAWSAGAMAIGPRVVLFHDSPPQGAGNTEVFEMGLGLYDGLVPLPHARRRLRLEDPQRVGILARRFAPDVCVPLGKATSVTWRDNHWQPGPSMTRLDAAGKVTPWERT